MTYTVRTPRSPARADGLDGARDRLAALVEGAVEVGENEVVAVEERGHQRPAEPSVLQGSSMTSASTTAGSVTTGSATAGSAATGSATPSATGIVALLGTSSSAAGPASASSPAGVSPTGACSTTASSVTSASTSGAGAATSSAGSSSSGSVLARGGGDVLLAELDVVVRQRLAGQLGQAHRSVRLARVVRVGGVDEPLHGLRLASRPPARLSAYA